jgi:NAD(P)-dependent dehydrogenase (short-subunit alcohol dehydrogenase family)
MIQRALVVGGIGRIGRAIALDLARSGYSIALQYSHSADEVAETLAAIREAGGATASLRASLADPAEVEALIPATVKAMGPLTCLVNVASHFAGDCMPWLTAEGWRNHMAVNLDAPVFLCQAFASQLPAEVEGNIVNIIDRRALQPDAQFFSYTLSQSALWAATKSMALALAPQIRVNAIGPGPALGRIGESKDGTTAEEIASTVLFILRTPAMTGQIIALGGGALIGNCGT